MTNQRTIQNQDRFFFQYETHLLNQLCETEVLKNYSQKRYGFTASVLQFFCLCPKNYRTDDVAILRSFVNCQPPLTLQKNKQRVLADIIFTRKKERKERKKKRQCETERALLFLVIKGRFAIHLKRPFKAQQTWKSIMERYLKSVTNPYAVN